jgi:hypothetical protein
MSYFEKVKQEIAKSEQNLEKVEAEKEKRRDGDEFEIVFNFEKVLKNQKKDSTTTRATQEAKQSASVER